MNNYNGFIGNSTSFVKPKHLPPISSAAKYRSLHGRFLSSSSVERNYKSMSTRGWKIVERTFTYTNG